MRKVMLGVGVVLLLAATACDADPGSYEDKRGRGDAPVGVRDDRAAEIINMPDGWPNLATKCDGHGHRVYATREMEGTPRQVVVIGDEDCND